MTYALVLCDVDAAIKYLAFLADSQQLFDTALSQSNFTMARSIARQTQMDPKLFMPLLEKFEAIGRGHVSESLRGYYMRYSIHLYLKKYDVALSMAFQCLKIAFSLKPSEFPFELTSYCVEILQLVTKHSLYALALAELQNICPYKDLQSFINEIRQAYGNYCITEMKYDQAITSFLNMQPANVKDAIRAATLAGNWELVLTLSSRYAGSSGYASLTIPKKLAYELISQYREGLQQVHSNSDPMIQLFSNYATIVITEEGIETSSAAVKPMEDKSLEAAKICVDYCQNIEDAIGILIMAYKWLPAIQLAYQHNRKDLFDADVSYDLSRSISLSESQPSIV
jgi:hypothetical protein